MRGLILTTMLTLLSGCPSARVVAPPPTPQPPRPAPPKRFTVGTAAQVPAWLQAPCNERCMQQYPTYDTKLLAHGAQTSVVRTNAGQLLAFSESAGAIGPLQFPAKLLWVRVLAGGRLVAADSTGKLWHATGPQAATVRSGWSALPKAPPGYVADASAQWLAFADRDRVAIVAIPSPPEAVPKRFEISVPSKGMSVQTLIVRADGIVVAQLTADGARPLTMVTRNGGKSWKKAEFQAKKLRRRGGWIWNDDTACPAVLSSDGTRWTRDVDLNRLETVSWTAPLQVSTTLDASPPVTRATPSRPAIPAPPSASKHRVTGTDPCPKGSGALGIGGGGSAFGMLGRGCSGVSCLRGTIDTLPPRTRLHAGLFRDASCAASDGKSELECRKGARLTRLPHVAVGDRITGHVEVRELPKGCIPKRLEAVRGLTVLVCQGGKLYAADVTRKRWLFEGRLDDRYPWASTMAADGTLMLHLSCPRGSSCAAWVRRPAPIGTPDVWRAVEVPGALVYRVGLGGHALGLADKDKGQVRLTVDDPSGKRSHKTISIPRKRGTHKPHFISEVTVAPAGEVVFFLRVPRRKWNAPRLRWKVRGDGRLATMPPLPHTRDKRGAIIRQARPVDPAR